MTREEDTERIIKEIAELEEEIKRMEEQLDAAKIKLNGLLFLIEWAEKVKDESTH